MERFGEYGGMPVWLLRLQNSEMSCEVITYGAAIRKLTVPDWEGRPVDVVLGFDTLEEYVRDTNCFGAAIGPVANRVGKAVCPLGGKTCFMTKNDGENSLHSGTAGFHTKVWSVMELYDDAVTLGYIHPDGLGGIPGDLRTAVTYSLRGRTLCVEYWAVSDRETLCNLTNHSYFNLDRHGAGPVTDHRITLFAHSFTPTDAHSIPLGSIRAVAGTPMDLTRSVRIGAGIDADLDQLKNAGGYDHNYLIDPSDEGMGFRPAALVKGANRGISMAVYTDRPCVQFYTGNYVADGLQGKDGAVYHRRQGFCLETQGFPDAQNQVSFPNVSLPAGRVWQSRTEYRFSAG